MHIVDEAVSSGYPVQKPIFMHYPDDHKTYDLQYEYLFGSDVMVKPVVQPDQSLQEVYLPEDDWIHLWTGKFCKGNQSVIVNCPIGYPPVFYRKDSSFRTLFEKITQIYGEKGERI